MLDDATAGFDPDPSPDRSAHSRRKLALWLSRPDHPLTARVLVNRLWLWHFGKGLVSTPNDFGTAGTAAVASRTARLAGDGVRGSRLEHQRDASADPALVHLSAGQPVSATTRTNVSDPENRYLWRMNRVRLEGRSALGRSSRGGRHAEVSRWAGRSVAPPLAEDELSAVGTPSQWPVNADPAEYNRRGIYILIRRNFTYPMLQAFDNPENAVSCPERDVTTVAPQALWALNNHVACSSRRSNSPAGW